MSSPSPSPCDGKLMMKTGPYSEAKNLGNGSCYRRTIPVDIGGHKWRIALYPNGKVVAGTAAGFMSPFLLLDDAAGGAGDDEDVHVKFRFAMHELGGSKTIFKSGEIAAAFNRRQNAHGIERFVSREDFEKSPLCKKDHILAIRCDVTVFPAGSKPAGPSAGKASAATAAPPPSSTRTAAPPQPSGLLHADLGRLLATKEGADVELEVSGKVFAAHKTVLAARSPVFKKDFFGPKKEKNTDFVRIDDMLPETFEALLQYMYTDSLPETAADVLVVDLLIAADRYGMKGLKSVAEDKMCNRVGVSTFLKMLPLAEKYKCCKLKKKCLGFIGSGSNARAIVAGNDFENLARSNPSVVKDVITEVLDSSEARSDRLINVCFYALLFLLLLMLAVLKK